MEVEDYDGDAEGGRRNLKLKQLREGRWKVGERGAGNEDGNRRHNVNSAVDGDTDG